MDEVWSFEHSLVCAVPKEFAWNFWTDVRNWSLDADVESVDLDGDFRPGARGVTFSKTSGKVEWQIAEVQPGRAVIEFAAPGAVAQFAWTFADEQGRTKITQRASLSGEQAAQYVESFGRGLEAGMPSGMRKLCESIEKAHGALDDLP